MWSVAPVVCIGATFWAGELTSSLAGILGVTIF